MKAPRAIAVIVCAWALLGCQAPPDGARALEDFERTVALWKNDDCTDARVVSEFTAAKRIRKFGIEATCTSESDPGPQTRFFKSEYVKLSGGWEFRGTSGTTPSEVADLSTREAVQAPQHKKLPRGALFPLAVLAIPVVLALVIFVAMLWILRTRKRHQPERPAGAGIVAKRVGPAPTKPKNHWTINPD